MTDTNIEQRLDRLEREVQALQTQSPPKMVDVVMSVPGPYMVKTIKVIRQFTHCDLKPAVDAWKKTPSVIVRTREDQAAVLISELQKLGNRAGTTSEGLFGPPYCGTGIRLHTSDVSRETSGS